MKKLLTIMAALLCVLLLASCGSDDKAGTPPPVEVECALAPVGSVTDEEETACVIDLVGFSSLDEFLEAAKNSTGGKDDIAQLASLEEILIPSSIPEEYKLYKITAGAADIAFWYMPEEYLKDNDSRLDGEAFQKHFMYIDSRNSSFDVFTEQIKHLPSFFTYDKYSIVNTSGYMVNWEESGRLITLYLPGHMDVVDGKVISTLNNEETIVASLDEICRTEKIIIE